MKKTTNNGMLSPVDYEMKQQKMNEAGVWQTRRASAFAHVERHVNHFKGTARQCFSCRANPGWWMERVIR
jgi:hypothetical protein